MLDFYVIVHVDKSTMKEDSNVAQEIRRIRKQEKFVEVKGNPCVVDYVIPDNSNIFVCGFYHGRQSWDTRCVDEQINALKREGYMPRLYLPATISLDP